MFVPYISLIDMKLATPKNKPIITILFIWRLLENHPRIFPLFMINIPTIKNLLFLFFNTNSIIFTSKYISKNSNFNSI